MFTEETITSTQWSAQVDTYQSDTAALRSIISTFIAAQAVPVGWDQTAGAQNREAQNADFARSGQAILNDLTIQADNRTTIQVSCQYQGSGALA